MRTKLEPVNEQFYQLYFSFSITEVEKMFEEVFDKYTYLPDSDEAIEEIKEKIDNEILEDEIEDLDLVVVGPRITKFMTTVKKGKPLMGITQMCVLPDDINISLPTFIPEELFKFDIDDETVENLIKEILIGNNLYSMEEVNIVDEDSVITYDLCYTNDDLLINKIENQEFDMQSDDELNPKLFINKKVGNEVVIDKSEITTIAKITKIEKKVPYSLTDEVISKLKFGSVKTKSGFVKKIKSILEFQKDIQISVFYITEAILSSGQFKFSDVVINYFLKAVNKVENKITESLKNNIRRMLIMEYLIKIVELKTDDDFLSESTEKKLDDLSKLIFLADGRKPQTFTRTLFEDQVRQVRLLEYCKEAGLISNIRL